MSVKWIACSTYLACNPHLLKRPLNLGISCDSFRANLRLMGFRFILILICFMSNSKNVNFCLKMHPSVYTMFLNFLFIHSQLHSRVKGYALKINLPERLVFSLLGWGFLNYPQLYQVAVFNTRIVQDALTFEFDDSVMLQGLFNYWRICLLHDHFVSTDIFFPR